MFDLLRAGYVTKRYIYWLLFIVLDGNSLIEN